MAAGTGARPRDLDPRPVCDPARVRAYINCCVELARATGVTLPEMRVALDSMLRAADDALAGKARGAAGD